MASQNPNSRLAQMQMRFQQKQQQEREKRLTEISHSKETAQTNDKTLIDAVNESSKTIGNGKVRQMFNERRRGAGIDRSNPLKPIDSHVSSVRSKTQPTIMKQQNRISATSSNNNHNNNNSIGINAKQYANSIKSKSTALSNQHETIGIRLNTLNLTDSAHSDRNNNNARGGISPNTKNAKLNPVQIKKSPTITQQLLRSTQPIATTSTNINRVTGGRDISINKNSSQAKNTSKFTVQKISMSSKPPPRDEVPPEGMSKCRFCGRNFNNDRLAKHESVCEKMHITKRKIFDASKQRVRGTESEKFLKKNTQMTRTNSTYSSAIQVYGLNTEVKKNNWRKKHEDFIQSIRAAKKVQAHLSKGGKLSDLPPPPPSENPDYIQCPHCLRRFNQQAAERHIPKCANMLHNKPKPGDKQKGAKQSFRKS